MKLQQQLSKQRLKQLALMLLLVQIFNFMATPLRAWYFTVPLATRLLPYTAGLIQRGTTWVAGSIAQNAQVWRIAETITIAGGAAIYAQYLMEGDQTSPATTGKIRVTLALKPNEPRSNPDNTKWDDPTVTVDPTPKQVLPSSNSAYGASSGISPATYLDIINQVPVGTTKTYNLASGKPAVYWHTQSSLSTTEPSYKKLDGTTILSGSFPVGQLFWNRGYTKTNNPTPHDHVFYLVYAVTANTFRNIEWTDISSCPAGYTASGTTCNLTDATQIMKPDMPCEIVEVNGQWQTDPKNPSCIGTNAQAFSTNGSTARLNHTDGTATLVTRNSDGGLTIEDANPTSGTSRIVTGPYSQSNNGYPINSISQTAPGNNTGTNPGSAAGNCGAQGQTPCAVSLDTSGFAGTDTQVNNAAQSATSKLDDRKSNFDALQNSQETGNHGIDPTGLFGLNLPQVTCQPLHYPFFNTTLTLDLCEGSLLGPVFAFIRTFLSITLSISAAWYLWRRFTTGTVGLSH